jgi:hypothetical protein
VTEKTWGNLVLLSFREGVVGTETGRDLGAALSVFDVMRRVVPVILERIEQTKEDVAALLAEQYGQGSRIQ